MELRPKRFIETSYFDGPRLPLSRLLTETKMNFTGVYGMLVFAQNLHLPPSPDHTNLCKLVLVYGKTTFALGSETNKILVQGTSFLELLFSVFSR
ncbi:hypothetical protein SLE2022_206550 [Rubroshorea leprosula]